jgi:hypothetical protein
MHIKYPNFGGTVRRTRRPCGTLTSFLALRHRSPDCVLPDELGVTLGGTCLTLYGQNKTIPVNESCVLDCINSTYAPSIGAEGTVFSCSVESDPSTNPATIPVCTMKSV